MSRRRRRSLRPFLDELDERCLLSGYTPAQITAAYSVNAIAFTTSSGSVKGDGAGETIALIELDHDPNLSSDLHTFDQKYGLPDPTLNVDDLAGSQTDRGWAVEESLDVEWAHAIAPGASILVVEAAQGFSDTQDLQDLMAAVNTASHTPGVTVVSMSWGFSEFPGEASYDPDFTTPGITYIAAGGDSPGVDYPAASPDVLAVGGTTLTITSSGAYGSETAWNNSGGGYSQYESEPSYQESVQTTGQRSTPDVAFVADPNTGVAVYETPPSGGQGQGGQTMTQGSWQVVGGTSLGAPAWAGIIAIVDQGRALTGLDSLSGATQTLPSLYSAAAGDFNAVAASQSNSPWIGNGGGFPWGGFGGWSNGGSSGSGLTTTVGATANTQTGLGSPIGSSLIDDLAASTLTSPLPTPTPTPAPTPSPTPTSRTKHHHHHKRIAHSTSKKKVHRPKAHAKRVVAQKHKTEHARLHAHDHSAS
jgi:subtilase family serine protease